MPGRESSIDTIQRELTAFARRARHKASQLHPDLSLVTYSILDLITERGGSRAADVAAYFMLDKSTVSRQVGALEKLGLLAREADPDDQRGQILRATDAGLTLLRDANEQRRQAFTARFTDWSDEDVARFAAYLARYGAEG
ncbi:MarR family winged helix-turn-helix transcriptional regulator [Streptomyces rubellomurinus]|uniref:MarR family transcriptional regulator n=2 Tax=Streptomyces TaxID=1883 RepID=A0A0F2TBB7_STRR3|nr:MarR family transcriptional regulator [Streptomyces rubellomurinus]KJS54433.1 MarR family transcriptional regulator [Streptomyces rubellomurinus subsp. indigoferus]KJS60488.1 MarR family transcriptional regulator [Streptomyces rubellomurinus]